MLTTEELDRALRLFLHQDDTNVALGWEILRGHPEQFMEVRIPLFLIWHLSCPCAIKTDLGACIQQLFSMDELKDWQRALRLLASPSFESHSDLHQALALHEAKRPF